MSINVGAYDLTKTFEVEDKALTGDTQNSEMTLTFEDYTTDVTIDEDTDSKFTDKLLFGSGDFGHKNGTFDEASIGTVWSMVVDNDKNVWFIDGSVPYDGMGSYWNGSLVNENGWTKVNETTEYKNQFLRKYDPKTNEVTTIKKLSTLKLRYKNDLGKIERLSVYRGYKLVHDPKTNKVFMSGKFVKNGGKPDYRGTLIQVSPEFKPVVADKSFNWMFGSDDFAYVDSKGAIVYSRKDGSALDVFRVKDTSRKYVDVVGDAGSYNSVLQAIPTTEYLYVLQSNVGGMALDKYSMSKGTWERVETFTGKYDSISSLNDKFYASKGGEVDIINIDGSVEAYVDSDGVTSTTGFSKGTKSLMQVLEDGSIVYYDSIHNMFGVLSKQ
jgi:hypothetical protein